MAKDRNDSEAESEPDPLSYVEHIKMGVWDLYIMRTRLSGYLPTSWKTDEYAQMWKDLPYLWRTLRDMSTVAWPLLLLYLVITLVNSLVPALSLWYAGPFFGLESGRRLQIFFQVFWTSPWNSEHLCSLEPKLEPLVADYFSLACRHNLPSTIVPLIPISYFG